MNGHTKEPWHVYADETAQVDGFPCIDGDGQVIVGTEGFYSDLDRDFANARRIVSCVNALAGYNPAALAALVEAAAVAWRQRVNPECFCDADVEMATEKLGQALTAFREGSAS